MQVKFELRPDKRDTTGRVPVFVTATFDGLRLRAYTREKCLPAQWNADKQLFRKGLTGYEDANHGLERLRERLFKRYRELRAESTAPTVALLREVVNPAPAVVALPVVEPLVVEELTAFREVMRARGLMRNTLRHYLITRNWLLGFEAWAGVQLRVSTYNLAQHDALLAYLRQVRGLAPNTLYTVGKDLRRLFGYLRDERGAVLVVEPKKLRVAWVETEKLYLQADELTQLAAALLPATLVPVRDVFLFCCYTGLRYSDVLQLHGGNVEVLADGSGRVLRLTQTKTRTKVNIYLNGLASLLLDKYACAERSGPGARLLPVFANQVMNRYLKRIGQLAELTRLVEVSQVTNGQVIKRAVPAWEMLTMHAARHSFAVQSLLRGVPVAVLQRVMGHSSITTTMIYAKVVEDFQHQAMRAAWDGPVAATPLPAVVCEVRASVA